MTDRPPPPIPKVLAAQWCYQLRLLLRTPRATFGGVLLPLLLLVVREQGHREPRAAQASTVIGLAVLGMASTAYITYTSGLVLARESGVLKRWRATPLPPWCFFAARIGAAVPLAVAGGFATVLAGVLLYGFRPPASGVAAALVALALGAAALAAAGSAASILVASAEAAWPLLGATYLPMVLLSGGFGTVGSGWIYRLMDYLPVKPVVDAAARALSARGGATHWPTARELLVLAAWTIVGIVITQRRFRWEARPAGRGACAAAAAAR